MSGDSSRSPPPPAPSTSFCNRSPTTMSSLAIPAELWASRTGPIEVLSPWLDRLAPSSRPGPLSAGNRSRIIGRAGTDGASVARSRRTRGWPSNQRAPAGGPVPAGRRITAHPAEPGELLDGDALVEELGQPAPGTAQAGCRSSIASTLPAVRPLHLLEGHPPPVPRAPRSGPARAGSGTTRRPSSSRPPPPARGRWPVLGPGPSPASRSVLARTIPSACDGYPQRWPPSSRRARLQAMRPARPGPAAPAPPARPVRSDRPSARGGTPSTRVV